MTNLVRQNTTVMKKYPSNKTILILIVTLLLFACVNERKEIEFKPVDWQERTIEFEVNEKYQSGSSYLSVYSEIFDHSDEMKHLLTATVSIRNTSFTDSLFILTADYYNTNGEAIRSYVELPVFLTPLETIEIVIPRLDITGGSGANFIFDWAIHKGKHEPIFEAVMVWTTGNQGISFVTHGRKL